jgi:DNA-binding response OmpR family regulator
MDGLDVCQAIREKSTTPVIFLSGRAGEEHVIKGFRSGADDYISKPFSTRVLTARIEAVCRRANGKAHATEAPRQLKIAGLSIDVDSHEIHRPNGELVRLTPIEFRILHALIMAAPRVVSNERLVDYAWNYYGGDVSLLKTHISHIRRKLGLCRHPNGGIVSITGVGYRLSIAPDAD